VTLSLQAPEATDVKLAGDFVSGPQPMKKGDDGAWTITGSGRFAPPSTTTPSM
jgi:hypothetical protein